MKLVRMKQAEFGQSSISGMKIKRKRKKDKKEKKKKRGTMRKATFSFYGNCILLYQELLPPLTTAIEITIFSIFLEIDIWSY